MEAHLESDPLATPVHPVVRLRLLVRLGHNNMQILARGARVRVRVRHATNLVVHLLHRREVPRVAPHAVDEDEEVDVVARAALCFTHSYEAKSGKEEGG